IAWIPQVVPVMLIASGIVPRHLILHLPGRSGESQVTDIDQLLSNRALSPILSFPVSNDRTKSATSLA
ncbi:MAG: hypothetical protein AAGI34_13490, partial [Pseudomonadota bacterium]